MCLSNQDNAGSEKPDYLKLDLCVESILIQSRASLPLMHGIDFLFHCLRQSAERNVQERAYF